MQFSNELFHGDLYVESPVVVTLDPVYLGHLIFKVRKAYLQQELKWRNVSVFKSFDKSHWRLVDSYICTRAEILFVISQLSLIYNQKSSLTGRVWKCKFCDDAFFEGSGKNWMLRSERAISSQIRKHLKSDDSNWEHADKKFRLYNDKKNSTFMSLLYLKQSVIFWLL
jgi:hypothetical protein